MPVMTNAHALVVGITGYQHINPLPPVADAQEIRDLLVDQNHCAYPPQNVQLLLEEQATQAGIRQGLANLAQRADQDATVFIYFSGHGGQISSGSRAGAYLLPIDTRYPSDEALALSAISGVEFTNALNALQARKVVVAFDCCHAAGIGSPKDALAAPTFQAGLPDSYYDVLKSGRGRVILSSSRSNEYSYVLAGAKLSLFTTHLLAGLRGGVVSRDGMIRIFDLFEYLQPRVTAAHPSQHPIFKAEVEENFPVALYLGGEAADTPTNLDDYRYDAYISYVDADADAAWVWETLAPRLEEAGLRVAVSNDVEEPGVARVVTIERGIRQAKRTVLVLSNAYLASHLADFENILAQTLGIQEGSYRLLPVKIAPIDESRLPVRLSMLTMLDFTRPARAEREFDRLVRSLRGPLPRQLPNLTSARGPF
ncbi:caspase family protein [Candidatus Amarolinea aalborgensis]|uniref:caspase family protein n=1 Tax=Candidatus Amarolinea aalborgensis TaxID=2249329 RepID=UPI003BF9C9B5